jgi:hypothetical protein
MGENTRLLYDLMHYLEDNDLDGLLLLVDKGTIWRQPRSKLKKLDICPLLITQLFDSAYKVLNHLQIDGPKY